MIIIDESSMMMHHHFSIIIICVISTLTVHPTCVGIFANKFSQPLLMLKPLLMFETFPNVETSPYVWNLSQCFNLSQCCLPWRWSNTPSPWFLPFGLATSPSKKVAADVLPHSAIMLKNMLWIYRFTQIGGICTNCLFRYLCIIDQPFIYDCELLSVELDQMLANYSTFEKWWHTATQIVNCAVQLWEKSQYQEVTEEQYSPVL